MKDRFDFEQDIYNCWHIIDDLQQLYKMILNKNTSTEDIANILLGLQTLYNDRFLQLMDDFEMEENLMTTDLKLKGIEIDFETADNIIRASMLNQYHDIKRKLKIKKMSNLHKNIKK